MLVILLTVGCSEPANENGVAGPAAGEPASAGQADRTVQVLARDDLSFSPPDVEVAVGEIVTFEVTNHGATPHEFFLGNEEEQREHAEQMRGGGAAHHTGHGISVQPGATERLTWRFTQAGVMEAGCHVPGHYDAGMYVTIRVAPSA